MAKPKTRPYTDTQIIDLEAQINAVEEYLNEHAGSDEMIQLITDQLRAGKFKSAKDLALSLFAEGSDELETMRDILCSPKKPWRKGYSESKGRQVAA